MGKYNFCAKFWYFLLYNLIETRIIRIFSVWNTKIIKTGDEMPQNCQIYIESGLTYKNVQ